MPAARLPARRPSLTPGRSLSLLLALGACAEAPAPFGQPKASGADGADEADGGEAGADSSADDAGADDAGGGADGADGGGSTDSGAADGGEGAADGGAADTGWPDRPEVSRAPVSLVVDGALRADGDRLDLRSAPAGIDEDSVIDIVLTNRSGADLALPVDPAAWLSGAGWELDAALVDHLGPDEGLDLRLRFNPAAETAATTRAARFTVPVEGGPTVELRAEVPRPLRLVVTGDDGWLAVSDDYGRSLRELSPVGAAADGGPITWGGGRFFRAVRSGEGWFTTAQFAYSDDGELWSASTYADDFWVSDCAYGLGRFFCVRSDTVTWSARGETVYHEATAWGPLRNGVAFGDDRFIAVGRSGARVISADGSTWTGGSTYAGGDEYRDIVAFPASDGTTVWVAVGGTDRMLISRSVDGGETWADTTFCDTRYAHLLTVAHSGGVLVATGGSNVCNGVWRSEDAGLTWAPLALGTGNFYLVGAWPGAFLGVLQPWGGAASLMRSADGATWETVATLPIGVLVRSAAIEGR
ncbi:MAG: exo-alpha-sialidase [Deltaproteobacteria bacterium]|nr:exo-alpha-sialidase [Deltaproteobacteria bacterium]